MILPATWELPIALRSRVSPTSYGRQRALLEEGHLLLILHRPPGPDDDKREGVVYWRNPAGEWSSSRGGNALGSLKKHVQEYAQHEAELTDAYEKASDATSLFGILEAVEPLDRAARNMHAAIQTARDGTGDDAFLIELRDAAYDVERNLDLLLRDTRNAIQFRTLKEAEEQGRQGKEALRASHRLNILIALFLPISALGSMFGMNLPHGLGESQPLLFWAIFGLGIAFGAGMVAWVVAKPKAS